MTETWFHVPKDKTCELSDYQNVPGVTRQFMCKLLVEIL